MLGEDEEEPTGVIHLFNVEMTLHLKPCIKRAAEETESASGEVEIFTLVMAWQTKERYKSNKLIFKKQTNKPLLNHLTW